MDKKEYTVKQYAALIGKDMRWIADQLKVEYQTVSLWHRRGYVVTEDEENFYITAKKMIGKKP